VTTAGALGLLPGAGNPKGHPYLPCTYPAATLRSGDAAARSATNCLLGLFKPVKRLWLLKTAPGV